MLCISGMNNNLKKLVDRWCVPNNLDEVSGQQENELQEDAQISLVPFAPSLSSTVHQRICENTALVLRVARKVHWKIGRRIDLDELIALGNLGLVQAAKKYHTQSKACFSTFARYRIHGAIMDGIGKIATLSRSRYRLRKPTLFVTANAVPKPQTREQIECSAFDGLPQQRTADWCTEVRELSHQLAKAMRQLPADERKLITNYYFRNKSLTHAGKSLGVSKSWASRLHERALRHLRCLMVTGKKTG